MFIHIFRDKFKDDVHRFKVMAVAARLYQNGQGVCKEDELSLLPIEEDKLYNKPVKERYEAR